jgi:class 3 adenylate cyclase/dienelactone hydrolase
MEHSADAMRELPLGTVTFLFTDIEGSTALLHRLGDRGYREVLETHDGLLQSAFAAYQGQIVETQGDAFFVAFRSARAAVDATIAAQRAIVEQAWPSDAPVRVRAGLHTGEPLAGGKGYVGLGIHRAARISSAGHGGQILLSQTTADLIENDLPPGASLLDLGEHRLKDLQRPERIFQVRHPDLPASFPPLKSQEPSSQSAGATHRSPLAERLRRVRLVGRVESLRRLVERLEGIRTGPTGMVVISGEPGIGKSRLLDELVAAARSRGFEVLIGRCYQRSLAIPYHPVAEAMEGLARSTSRGDWDRLMAAAGPQIQILLTDLLVKHRTRWDTVLHPGSSAFLAARAELGPAPAVRNLLHELSRSAPVLLAIDDLHWADRPTLELLHGLVLSIRDLPVLIVGAYREVELERTHPLSRLLVELNRERLLHRERLRRLDPAETEEFLRELLNGPAPDGVADLVHNQTEGNPFFVEELVSGLVEDERLVGNSEGSGFALAPGLTVEQLAGEVPQGIRAAIGARLDRVEPADQQVLSLASVIGRGFPTEVLVRLCGAHGIGEEAVDGALERAQAARFVGAVARRPGAPRDVQGYTAGSAEPGADWVFDHSLIHQVVYGELDRRRRRRLHVEVGRLFEEVYHGREGLYSERLAYHYLEGDDEAKALQYSLSAGDKMLRAYYDPDMALGYYLLALEALIGRDPSLRRLKASSPLALRRGAAHRFTPEERDAAIGYLGEVLQIVRGTTAAQAIAQLANRICVAAMHTGDVYQQSIRLYEEALLGPNVEKVVVPTSRGNLVGLLEFPGEGGPHPVVLMFHGSMSTKETLAEDADRYLARGLATLRVDLPGFGETTVPVTASPADAEVLREMVSAVLAHPRVDPRGVGLWGISLSPWHAAHLCARDERVRAMVSISGMFNPLESHLKGTEPQPALIKAWRESRYKAGARPTPEGLSWSADASVYDVADRIRCPMLLVYGALEPELYRIQSEQMTSLVPTARTRVWRSGVHALLNVPEAHEEAADWMKGHLRGHTA